MRETAITEIKEEGEKKGKKNSEKKKMHAIRWTLRRKILKHGSMRNKRVSK